MGERVFGRCHTSEPTGHNGVLQWLVFCHTTLASTVAFASWLVFRDTKVIAPYIPQLPADCTRLALTSNLVMERTGHHILEGVGSYKHTSDTQLEVLSDILTCTNRRRVEDRCYCCLLKQFQHSQELRALSVLSTVFNNCTVNFYVGTPPVPEQQQKWRAVITG